MKNVYLAGGKSQWWRNTVKTIWEEKAHCIDPFTDSRQQAIYEFTNDDLAFVERSQLVFCVVDYFAYTGCALEVGFARALEIPVVLVWDVSSENTPVRVDPMMAACSTVIFTEVQEAAYFVLDRYLLK